MLITSIHRFFASVLTLGLALGLSAPAGAGEYPDKPIRVIVHVKPGGGTDTMARLVLKYAGEKLGTTFVVEDHSGAGGQRGYTALSRAKPDGYTIGTITTMSFVNHELTRKNVPYTVRDSFLPIARIVLAPSAVYVRADSPYQTLEDLIKAGKEKPGKINWATGLFGGTHQVHMQMLENAAAVKFKFVPFDGSSEVRAAILGGHTDAAAGGFAFFAPLIEQGKLRALAVAAPERSPILASVPTYKEQGYNIVVGSNRGFAAPAGTSMEIVDKLSQTFAAVLKDPEFLKDADKIGIRKIIGYLDAKTFRTFLLDLQETLRAAQKKKDAN